MKLIGANYTPGFAYLIKVKSSQEAFDSCFFNVGEEYLWKDHFVECGYGINLDDVVVVLDIIVIRVDEGIYSVNVLFKVHGDK